jgi:hypothetical protein
MKELGLIFGIIMLLSAMMFAPIYTTIMKSNIITQKYCNNTLHSGKIIDMQQTTMGAAINIDDNGTSYKYVIDSKYLDIYNIGDSIINCK